jgi:serine protease inhibitor ecotin
MLLPLLSESGAALEPDCRCLLRTAAVPRTITGWDYQYFITDALTFETLKRHCPQQKLCTALVKFVFLLIKTSFL